MEDKIIFMIIILGFATIFIKDEKAFINGFLG